MIRKLKIKLVATIAVILVLVFAIVLVTLNLFMHGADSRDTAATLEMLAQQDGFLFEEQPLPDGWSSEGADLGDPNQAPGSTGQTEQPRDDKQPKFEQYKKYERYFYAKVDPAGNILEINVDMMFNLSEQEAQAYVEQVLSRSKDSGTLDDLQYLVKEKAYGSIVVFAEKSVEAKMLAQLTQISLWVAGGSCVVMLLLALLLANWMVKPVQQSFDRQRRFISDASHELKTPITIISANADLLEGEVGRNKWLGGIKQQASRMSGLIADLLTLARSDEAKEPLQMGSLNLSEVVEAAALEFESRAYEENRKLNLSVEPDIEYRGDKQRLRQLIGILLDNALTHSEPGSEVELALALESGKRVLTVSNTGGGIAESEKEMIFERFYRSDASRSRETGGYGLGLSIAKSIVEAHKGSIAADSEGGKTTFTVKL